LGVSQVEAARLAERGTTALARLLLSESDPEQLELLLGEVEAQVGETSITWFSEILVDHPRRTSESVGSSSMDGGRAGAAPSTVHPPDLRGIGPPAVQLQLM